MQDSAAPYSSVDYFQSPEPGDWRFGKGGP
jgi:hypothetical protein